MNNSNNPVRPLTAKEKLALEFIESYLLEKGIAPSYQEIQSHFGFASIHSVQRYLKQLQKKEYIFIPGGNQKRAITILKSSQTIQSSLKSLAHSHQSPFTNAHQERTPLKSPPRTTESLSLPLLGRVAAGVPLEAIEHDEFAEVPSSWIRYPNQTFALKVEGQSMVNDGIFDGDIIFVQEQNEAQNGEIVVAVVDNEATVKHFYNHFDEKVININPQTDSHFTKKQIELRPANDNMESMWFSAEEVEIKGLVVALIRQY